MDSTYLFKKSSIAVKSGLGVVKNHWGEVKNALIAVKNRLGVLQKDFFVVRIGPAKDKKAVGDVCNRLSLFQTGNIGIKTPLKSSPGAF